MQLRHHVTGIGALADETRRRLYEHVIAADTALGREQVAAELGLPLHKAKFHLDRLVEAGLLDVDFVRLTGRSGPGAGRPSKLYKRAARQFEVTLPPRRYDVMGAILAAGVDSALAGADLVTALTRAAEAAGQDLVTADAVDTGGAGGTVVTGGTGGTGGTAGQTGALTAVADVLRATGYEPRLDEQTLWFANCPFDTLAQSHPQLVCGLSTSMVRGVVTGLGRPGIEVTTDPEPGRCCVRAHLSTPEPGPPSAQTD